MRASWIVLCAVLCLFSACSGNKSDLDPTKQSDKELYDRAAQQLQDKNYMDAREAFKLVFDSFPKSDYRILAKLGYADCYYLDGGDSNWLLAIQEYQDFISLFPFSPKAEYAQAQIGMSYFQMREKPDRDQTNTRKALEEFRKVIDNYPNGQYYRPSYEKLIECYGLLAQHEYIIAFYYHRSGKHIASVDRIKGLLKQYPESVYKPEYYWLLGRCLEDLEQFPEACTYYNTAMTKWPESEVAGKVKEGAARVCSQQ